MRCPSCRSTENKVVDSRVSEGGVSVRRRRRCLECGRRFTTRERLEDELKLIVIKSNGRRVPYERDKILRGVERACYKLDCEPARLRELVDQVESDLFANHDREATTEHIGRYVGRHLRRLNAVAYVRFMSVHRKYSTVDEFIEEIRDVRKQVAQDSPEQGTLF